MFQETAALFCYLHVSAGAENLANPAFACEVCIFRILAGDVLKGRVDRLKGLLCILVLSPWAKGRIQY